ncbi:hypothetical protein [Cupriavidus numazuensis]|uniref:hypothetical protein n=1 Tax=Cupriavidus numazuensis TaxID=221992 RepID=UPI001BAC0926|nr:hypothetical protein [Cupriavidus numazuensis]
MAWQSGHFCCLSDACLVKRWQPAMVALLENPRTAPPCMASTAQFVVIDTFFLCVAQKPLDMGQAFPRIAIVAAHQSNHGSALTYPPSPGLADAEEFPSRP